MKNVFVIGLSSLVLIGSAMMTSSVTLAMSLDEAVTAFESVLTVKAKNIVVPTVLNVPVSLSAQSTRSVLVVDSEGVIVPAILSTQSTQMPTPIRMSTDKRALPELTDDKSSTIASFPIEVSGEAQSVALHIKANQVFATSEIVLHLANNVSLPPMVTVRNLAGGQDVVVRSESFLTSRTIEFPSVTTNHLVVTLRYVQPLHIAKVRILEDNVERGITNSIRFLAMPAQNYQVYFNADRLASVDNVGEMPNLQTNKGVKNVTGSVAQNFKYAKADSDADGIPDEVDNCVDVANPEQTDIDGNNRGDVCDDFDRDNIINSLDNCPNHPNRAQTDTDVDGIGDACDGVESRWAQAQEWLPTAMIFLVTIVVGVMLWRTLARKK